MSLLDDDVRYQHRVLAGDCVVPDRCGQLHLDLNQIHVEGPYPWALLDVEGGIYTFRSGQRLPKDKDDNSAVRERLQAQLRRMRERENADR